MNRTQIEKLINKNWELYEKSIAKGELEQAEGYADVALQLVQRLPENSVLLRCEKLLTGTALAETLS